MKMYTADPEQESNRLKLWKNAFELAYGIPYHRLQNIAKDLPDQLRVVLNRRTCGLTMLSWRNKADCALKIKDKADIIIKAWEENAPDLFKDGSVTSALYHEIAKLWSA